MLVNVPACWLNVLPGVWKNNPPLEEMVKVPLLVHTALFFSV